MIGCSQKYLNRLSLRLRKKFLEAISHKNLLLCEQPGVDVCCSFISEQKNVSNILLFEKWKTQFISYFYFQKLSDNVIFGEKIRSMVNFFVLPWFHFSVCILFDIFRKSGLLVHALNEKTSKWFSSQFYSSFCLLRHSVFGPAVLVTVIKRHVRSFVRIWTRKSWWISFTTTAWTGLKRCFFAAMKTRWISAFSIKLRSQSFAWCILLVSSFYFFLNEHFCHVFLVWFDPFSKRFWNFAEYNHEFVRTKETGNVVLLC